MAFEQQDNSGAIFVNDRKEKDTHPDRSGSARINGVDYWVSGWLRKTKDGNPYLSLAFKEKTPTHPPATRASRAPKSWTTASHSDVSKTP